MGCCGSKATAAKPLEVNGDTAEPDDDPEASKVDPAQLLVQIAKKVSEIVAKAEEYRAEKQQQADEIEREKANTLSTEDSTRDNGVAVAEFLGPQDPDVQTGAEGASSFICLAPGEKVEIIVRDAGGWCYCRTQKSPQPGWVPTASVSELSSLIADHPPADVSAEGLLQVKKDEPVEVVSRHYSGWAFCRKWTGLAKGGSLPGQCEDPDAEGWVIDTYLEDRRSEVMLATKWHRLILEALDRVVSTASDLSGVLEQAQSLELSAELTSEWIGQCLEFTTWLANEMQAITKAVSQHEASSVEPGASVVATEEIAAAGPNELSAPEGAKLLVLNAENVDWIWCRELNTGKEGWVPRLVLAKDDTAAEGVVAFEDLPEWVKPGEECMYLSNSNKCFYDVTIREVCKTTREIEVVFAIDPQSWKRVPFDSFAYPEEERHLQPFDDKAKELRSQLPSWVRPGRVASWWSDSQKRSHNVTIREVCCKRRMVSVAFDSDPKARKEVPFHELLDSPDTCFLQAHRKHHKWRCPDGAATTEEEPQEQAPAPTAEADFRQTKALKLGGILDDMCEDLGNMLGPDAGIVIADAIDAGEIPGPIGPGGSGAIALPPPFGASKGAAAAASTGTSVLKDALRVEAEVTPRLGSKEGMAGSSMLKGSAGSSTSAGLGVSVDASSGGAGASKGLAAAVQSHGDKLPLFGAADGAGLGASEPVFGGLSNGGKGEPPRFGAEEETSPNFGGTASEVEALLRETAGVVDDSPAAVLPAASPGEQQQQQALRATSTGTMGERVAQAEQLEATIGPRFGTTAVDPHPHFGVTRLEGSLEPQFGAALADNGAPVQPLAATRKGRGDTQELAAAIDDILQLNTSANETFEQLNGLSQMNGTAVMGSTMQPGSLAHTVAPSRPAGTQDGGCTPSAALAAGGGDELRKGSTSTGDPAAGGDAASTFVGGAGGDSGMADGAADSVGSAGAAAPSTARRHDIGSAETGVAPGQPGHPANQNASELLEELRAVDEGQGERSSIGDSILGINAADSAMADRSGPGGKSTGDGLFSGEAVSLQEGVNGDPFEDSTMNNTLSSLHSLGPERAPARGSAASLVPATQFPPISRALPPAAPSSKSERRSHKNGGKSAREDHDAVEGSGRARGEKKKDKGHNKEKENRRGSPRQELEKGGGRKHTGDFPPLTQHHIPDEVREKLSSTGAFEDLLQQLDSPRAAEDPKAVRQQDVRTSAQHPGRAAPMAWGATEIGGSPGAAVDGAGNTLDRELQQLLGEEPPQQAHGAKHVYSSPDVEDVLPKRRQDIRNAFEEPRAAAVPAATAAATAAPKKPSSRPAVGGMGAWGLGSPAAANAGCGGGFAGDEEEEEEPRCYDDPAVMSPDNLVREALRLLSPDAWDSEGEGQREPPKVQAFLGRWVTIDSELQNNAEADAQQLESMLEDEAREAGSAIAAKVRDMQSRLEGCAQQAQDKKDMAGAQKYRSLHPNILQAAERRQGRLSRAQGAKKSLQPQRASSRRRALRAALDCKISDTVSECYIPSGQAISDLTAAGATVEVAEAARGLLKIVEAAMVRPPASGGQRQVEAPGPNRGPGAPSGVAWGAAWGSGKNMLKIDTSPDDDVNSKVEEAGFESLSKAGDIAFDALSAALAGLTRKLQEEQGSVVDVDGVLNAAVRREAFLSNDEKMKMVMFEGKQDFEWETSAKKKVEAVQKRHEMHAKDAAKRIERILRRRCKRVQDRDRQRTMDQLARFGKAIDVVELEIGHMRREYEQAAENEARELEVERKRTSDQQRALLLAAILIREEKARMATANEAKTTKDKQKILKKCLKRVRRLNEDMKNLEVMTELKQKHSVLLYSLRMLESRLVTDVPGSETGDMDPGPLEPNKEQKKQLDEADHAFAEQLNEDIAAIHAAQDAKANGAIAQHASAARQAIEKEHLRALDEAKAALKRTQDASALVQFAPQLVERVGAVVAILCVEACRHNEIEHSAEGISTFGPQPKRLKPALEASIVALQKAKHALGSRPSAQVPRPDADEQWENVVARTEHQWKTFCGKYPLVDDGGMRSPASPTHAAVSKLRGALQFDDLDAERHGSKGMTGNFLVPPATGLASMNLGSTMASVAPGGPPSRPPTGLPGGLAPPARKPSKMPPPSAGGHDGKRHKGNEAADVLAQLNQLSSQMDKALGGKHGNSSRKNKDNAAAPPSRVGRGSKK